MAPGRAATRGSVGGTAGAPLGQGCQPQERTGIQAAGSVARLFLQVARPIWRLPDVRAQAGPLPIALADF
ncbi:protein of unknown function [Kyrpidia spormannii]|uniref:Uncharacterized protein n=1 Tax=Kyrpidia spormannii TaxID=2055160 RepID=A0A6F9E1S2_9BACL|nr:protein of unknown function [Kyrpidia spormannii]